MTIDELIKEAHETALEKGWWDKPRTFGDLISLCHSELSEALQEFRNTGDRRIYYEEDSTPHGVSIELADLVIRVADMASHYGIDLEKALKEKMAYNKNRPYRHGEKIL